VEMRAKAPRQARLSPTLAFLGHVNSPVQHNSARTISNGLLYLARQSDTTAFFTGRIPRPQSVRLFPGPGLLAASRSYAMTKRHSRESSISFVAIRLFSGSRRAKSPTADVEDGAIIRAQRRGRICDGMDIMWLWKSARAGR